MISYTYPTVTESSLSTISTTSKKYESIDKKKLRFSGCVADRFGKQVYIKRVVYNNPATIVVWSDDTKTVAKIHNNDVYSEETGLILCVIKKILGTNTVHQLIKDWIPDHISLLFPQTMTLSQVRKNNKK